MSQLRWTLLILGGLFIAGLALWERLRPRQARGRDPGVERATSEPVVGGLPPEALSAPGAGRAGEPWIADGPLETPVPSEESWREAMSTDPLADLPAVRVDEPPAAAPDAPPAAAPDAPPAAEDDLAATDEWEALEEGVGPVRILDTTEPDTAPSGAVASEPVADEPLVEPPSEPALRVEWPPESERHILALRLVAGAERFPGRTLRLALAAEGFRLGRFEIFHKPDDGGRALISAASLNRPGTFDPRTMDGQRYAGLNLFAVLPGPLPAPQAFDALLAAANHLNERLDGEVQDERGEALTAERIALLREALPGGADGALS